MNKSKINGSFVCRSRSQSQILNNNVYLEQEPYLGICFIHLNPYCSDFAALIWISALSNKHCPKIQEIPKSAHKKMSWHVTHDRWQVIFFYEIMHIFCVSRTRDFLKIYYNPKNKENRYYWLRMIKIFFIESSYMVLKLFYMSVRLCLLR